MTCNILGNNEFPRVRHFVSVMVPETGFRDAPIIPRPEDRGVILFFTIRGFLSNHFIVYFINEFPRVKSILSAKGRPGGSSGRTHSWLRELPCVLAAGLLSLHYFIERYKNVCTAVPRDCRAVATSPFLPLLSHLHGVNIVPAKSVHFPSGCQRSRQAAIAPRWVVTT